MLRIFRTGSPWRDLPAGYGDGSNTHRRFCRWRDKGIWEKLLGVFIDEPDFEWLMMDATPFKVRQHAAGERVVIAGVHRLDSAMPVQAWDGRLP